MANVRTRKILIISERREKKFRRNLKFYTVYDEGIARIKK